MRAGPRSHSRLTRALACALVVAALAVAGCGSSTAVTPAGGSTTGATSSGVQKFSVDLSSGTYVPAEIIAKADVPIEITFGQGRGCLRELVFPGFNVKEDMTKGPVTLKLGALKAGDYPWACGMDMEHGVLKVR